MRKHMLKEETVLVDLGIQKAEQLFGRDDVVRE